MAKDPIVDEVRRVREDLAAKFGFDIKAILMASKKRQRRTTHKVVSKARSWPQQGTSKNQCRAPSESRNRI
jgi:hypothetical protein